MTRVKFASRDLQRKFLKDVRQELKLTWQQLAFLSKVHKRTLFDWRRGKYNLPSNFLKRCINLTRGRVKIPSHQILPAYWSVHVAARKGGEAVATKYGGPGTAEGRKKGGAISQLRRRLHPERYAHCNIRKAIRKPRHSSMLAEFFGFHNPYHYQRVKTFIETKG